MKIETENENILSQDLKQELDFRYEHFLMHSDEYKDWDSIEHKYLQ